MNLLLDTHVLLWWLADAPELSEAARDLIRDSNRAVWVSAASAWEIAIKKALGKLEAPDDLVAALEANGFRSLPIRVTHALLAGSLPRIHDDPFDRMLVAQALCEPMRLLTTDKVLAGYGEIVTVF